LSSHEGPPRPEQEGPPPPRLGRAFPAQTRKGPLPIPRRASPAQTRKGFPAKARKGLPRPGQERTETTDHQLFRQCQ